MAHGHFCICPVDEIHNFFTFEFSTRFQHRRARQILLKIYKKFNYFSVFVKLIVTILLNVVSCRYDIYERSPQFLHINILTYEHTFMFQYIFLKIRFFFLKFVLVIEVITRVKVWGNVCTLLRLVHQASSMSKLFSK